MSDFSSSGDIDVFHRRFSSSHSVEQQLMSFPVERSVSIDSVSSNNSTLTDDCNCRLINPNHTSSATTTAVDSANLLLPDVTFCSGASTHLLSNSGSTQSPSAIIAENQPLLQRNHRMDPDSISIHNTFPEDPHFNNVIREAEVAIESGVFPQRISQGSSGSYFVRNSEGLVSYHFK